MKYLVLLGRILYAAIFISAALGHFTAGTIAYAAGKGVPPGLDHRSPVGDNRMPGGVEHPCGIQGSIRRLADRTFLGACYSHVTQLLGHRRANGGTNTIHYVHEESFHAGRSSLNRIFWFRTIQSG